ncbi:MAG: TonB family protein [Acidobacteria bacterium]|jgi:TonB family protein|nr:TonB family protein [Acidobacteriota bacterium]
MKTLLVMLICLFVQSNFAQSPVNVGILNIKRKAAINPKYPAAAIKAKASGTVNVSLTIDEQGNVITAEAVKGHELLREVSVAAARQTKFLPHIVNGKAVKVSGILVFNFVLPSQSPSDDFGADFFDNASRGFDQFDTEHFVKFHEIISIDNAKKDIQKGDYDAAIKKLNEEIIKNPKSSSALALRATAYQRKNVDATHDKDRAQALADSNASLAINPKETRALITRGKLRFEKKELELWAKDFDNAQTFLNKATSTNPKDVENHFLIAEMYEFNQENLSMRAALLSMQAEFRIKIISEYLQILAIDRKNIIAQKKLHDVGAIPLLDEELEGTRKEYILKSRPIHRGSFISSDVGILDDLRDYYSAGLALEKLNPKTSPPAEICKAVLEFKYSSDATEFLIDEIIEIYAAGAPMAFLYPDNDTKAKKMITFRTETLLPNKAVIDRNIKTYGCK